MSRSISSVRSCNRCLAKNGRSAATNDARYITGSILDVTRGEMIP